MSNKYSTLVTVVLHVWLASNERQPDRNDVPASFLSNTINGEYVVTAQSMADFQQVGAVTASAGR